MPASPAKRHIGLLFAAAVVCALAFAFSLGHLLGRWTEKTAKPVIVHSPTRTS